MPARPAPPRSTSSGLNDPWFIGFTDRFAVAVVLERVQGGTGGDGGRADRQANVLESLGEIDAVDRARHGDRRALPRPQPARVGRDGGRLLRRGHPARPPRRAQAAVPPLRRGRGVRRALPPRGLQRRRPAAPEHRRRSSTAGSGTAPTTSRWSTSTGRTLKQLVREHGAMPPDLRDRHHRPGPARRPLRPQARHRAPRLQAAQRDPRRGGARQGHRLRDRARRGVGHDRDRLDHGHRAVPLARAGAGPAGQPAVRPLLDRRDALRAADRPGARSTPSRRSRSRSSTSPSSRSRPPSSTRPSRPALDAVVMRALEKDPERRFADADEFAAALQAARDDAGRRGARRCVLEPYPMPGEPFVEDERRPSRWWMWLLAAAAARRAGGRRVPAARAGEAPVPDVVGSTLGGRVPAAAERRLRGRTSRR